MNREEILRNLEKTKSYRGQLYWEESNLRIPPTLFSLDDFPEVFKNLASQVMTAFGIEALYSHQGEVLKEIEKGKDVFLQAPEGSGKTACIDVAAMVFSHTRKRVFSSSGRQKRRPTPAGTRSSQNSARSNGKQKSGIF